MKVHRLNLQRIENGRFRPILKEPTNVQEAKLFREDLMRVEQANKLLDTVEQTSATLKEADNGGEDLNSTRGLVITDSAWPNSDYVESHLLAFEPATSEVKSFEWVLEGQESDRAILRKDRETIRYSASPFLLESTTDTSITGSDNWNFSRRVTVNQTEDNLFQLIITSDSVEGGA